MKKMFLAVIVVVIFVATSAKATETESGDTAELNPAEVRLAGYYDTREQENSTMTISKSWDNGVGVWGFIDLWTARANSELDVDDEADFVSFYGESNITYAISKHWKLMMELNDGSAIAANLRPGLRYTMPLENGWVGVKILPYKFELVDQDPRPDPSGQVGLAWRLNFLEDKVFFEGFADLNWRYGDHQDEFYPFITEPQLGFNLTKNSAFLVEYRYSALNPITKEADEGWAFGYEYRF